MRYLVHVKPGSAVDLVKEVAEGELIVYTRQKPVDNRANVAVIELMAKYFKKAKTLIRIKSGFSARTKVVDVD